MIIYWKHARMLGLKNNLGNTLNLMPGNNEVELPVWNSFRHLPSIKLKRAAGEIGEIGCTFKEVEDKTKGSKKGDKLKVIDVAKEFAEFEPKQAAEVVENTYSIPTLEKWLDACGKESVRAKLYQQIKLITKDGTSAAKKALS